MNDKPDEFATSGGPEHVDPPAAQAETAPGEKVQAQALSDLKAENAELRDKLLRLMAEMENYRRRAERERTEGMKYAVSEFARDAVSIGDNLRRAIEAAQKEPLDQNPALKVLLEGVEVTERDLIKVFERHGITRFVPMGEKFDPHVHEAMIKVDVPNVAADVIVQVLQAGYKINDRTLRPAAVIVAKGGTPAPEPQPPAEERPSNGAQDHASGSSATGEAGTSAGVATMQDHDPDLVRDPTGAPKGAGQQAPRRERGSGEKRSSTVTQPVTENSGPIKKDDLISSFGKRLENGS